MRYIDGNLDLYVCMVRLHLYSALTWWVAIYIHIAAFPNGP